MLSLQKHTVIWRCQRYILRRHTQGSVDPSMRFAKHIAAAAVTLGRYCKNVSPSSKLDSMRYCTSQKHSSISAGWQILSKVI